MKTAQQSSTASATTPSASTPPASSPAATNDGGGKGKKGRFTVKFLDHSTDSRPSVPQAPDDVHDGQLTINSESNDNELRVTVVEPASIPNEYEDNRRDLYLYKEDMKTMPRVATFLKTMMMAGTHTIYPSEKDEREAKTQPKKAKLGVMLGVYLPTIQHILGLLMFIRHAWIVGCSGVLESFFMVFMCCLTTFATAISVSAIATNGMVQGGGSYYMLSRNLGPECGGSIGICFYLANTFATCMYLLGAIELLLLYMAPGLAIFGDIHHDPWNNFRLYGTVFLLAITFVVGFGVKFVSFFAPVSLACVIISILSIFVGAFISSLKPKDIRLNEFSSERGATQI